MSLLTICCISSFTGASYLGYPRIHFAGQYRGDVNTKNNDVCEYFVDEPFGQTPSLDWNEYGTNDFELVSTKVTSVHYEDGTSSLKDSVVGQGFVGNVDRPHAKFVNDYIPCVYGLSLGIQWEDSKEMAFLGNQMPVRLHQSLWSRMKCVGASGSYHPYSIQFIATVTDVNWHSLGDSLALAQLQRAVGEGYLVMRITMFGYNWNPKVEHNFTYGYMMGVIAAPGPSETLGLTGDRAMITKHQPVGLVFDKYDYCYGKNLSSPTELPSVKVWTNIAPFEVDRSRREIRLDLSNSLPSNKYILLRDIGILRLGILHETCIYLLGEEEGLSYASSLHDLTISNGIYTIPVNHSFMDMVSNNPLVLVQVLSDDSGSDHICRDDVSLSGNAQSVQIILQEELYLLRPTRPRIIYMDRLIHRETIETVYVTKYGVPVQGLNIRIKTTLPEYDGLRGVIPSSWNSTTDGKGLATFYLRLNDSVRIPQERHYYDRPCDNFESFTVPIHFYEYFFYYCVGKECEYPSSDMSSIFALSDDNFTRPYTWLKDVGPIFEMYARMNAAMRNIIDLGNFKEVVLPRNLKLINLTLRLDINDASHMPTTRDLSPMRRNMILEWLEDPIYDLWNPTPAKTFLTSDIPYYTTERTVDESYSLSQRCRASALPFQDHPHMHDIFFEDVLHFSPHYEAGETKMQPQVRPLSDNKMCTLEEIKKQLQVAIQIEWATVPLYLTTLYSIVEGYNTEIRDLISSVVREEMFHMVQVANILIALNGSPLIDDASVAPSYPVTGLPGGVLPNLTISLERLSLEYVFKVFMAIEIPQRSLVASPAIRNKETTIGAFYGDLKDCIDQFGENIFNVSTADQQVKWPWDAREDVGDVITVTDKASALKAIDIIVSQGEGSGLLDPTEIGSEKLAHFYKFEEIVCRKHLVKVSDFHYAYSGAPIQFDPNGVWPMRSNPNTTNISPNCVVEYRAFHGIYRKILHRLQELLNGHPEDIFVVLKLMESLKIHAKKLTLTRQYRHDHHDNTTCGPVWDYTLPQL